MTVDIQELKDRYAAMPDEDFRAVTRPDLTDAARQCLRRGTGAARSQPVSGSPAGGCRRGGTALPQRGG